MTDPTTRDPAASLARCIELAAKATPGPWRWEYNATSKGVEIAGGVPTFDKTVMDFTRWGMNRAVPRFSGALTDADGFCILHKLSDRPDWRAPFKGREHHADWCADVTHPDAVLMVASVNFLRDEAPALLAEVERLKAEVLRWQSVNAANITLHRDRAEAAEQVAREAVGLLREARDMMANVPSWEPVSSRAAAFLAHHGARTGESNEA